MASPTRITPSPDFGQPWTCPAHSGREKEDSGVMGVAPPTPHHPKPLLWKALPEAGSYGKIRL
jgi:hypothetical protein